MNKKTFIALAAILFLIGGVMFYFYYIREDKKTETPEITE